VNGERPSRSGPGLWIGLALGVPVMTYGSIGLVRHADPHRVRDLAIWVVGGDVVHDLIVAPLMVLTVWAVGCALAPSWRTPVRSGLLASALVVALAWPGLSGLGNEAHNPTVHPFDQTQALAWVLAGIWSAVVVWCTLVLVNARGGSQPK
jgi:hypothetical protein